MHRNRRLSKIVILPWLAFLSACNMPSLQTEAEPIEDLTGPGPAVTQDPDLEHDPCLEGGWTMFTGDVDLMLATLSPVPNMHVSDGVINIFFEGGVYDYRGDVTLHLDMDVSEGQYLETEAVFTTGGQYYTNDSLLVLDLSTSESQILGWRAYKNGESVTAPGGLPSFAILPPGTAAYRCSEGRLEIDTEGPFGAATMFFQR